VEFVEWLNRSSDAIHADVISIVGEQEGVSFDIAMQYTGEFTENLHSYVNNISTTEGGTHVSGFRAALTRSLNAYGKKTGLYKDLVPTGDDVREGLTVVVSVRVPHPQFQGQTKTKLGNGEVEGIINSAVGDFLAGPSHTLPTGGAGKSFPGLMGDMFQRRTSIVRMTKESCAKSEAIVRAFADVEGLDAHGESVAIRQRA
jgi:DNA gyrase/topoisomerase IV subunit B